MMFWGPLMVSLILSQQPDARCTLRVSAKGVFVDGDAMTREQALAACKRTSGATVIVEDTAPQTWTEMRARLTRAGIKIHMRGEVGDHGFCLGNPLVKGCN
ncbi:MAG TPA: hypothetical protein VIV11_15095 [Kofleriaceae bacterium]